MATHVRNRLVALGVLWGLLLSVVPVVVMTSPYRLTGLLVAGLVCAVLSGAIGTLVAGRRVARSVGKSASGRFKVLLDGIATGVFQGLVGGAVAALLFWALMALTISGFTLRNPVEISILMSPRVFMGSFFVALSVFVYALAGGLLLGPVFGTLVNCAARSGGKENLVVR